MGQMPTARVDPSDELMLAHRAATPASDRKTWITNEKMAAQYLQRYDPEYPTNELAMICDFYRRIIDILNRKELSLRERFV